MTPTEDGTRTIQVDTLARVEGEGALYLRIEQGQLADLAFRIFEPPRFFEAFLRGRHMGEAPDITARICGICPVAYQMSAVHAIEQACGVALGPELRALRRLLYCGEWIESHGLHVYMLHAPDFLGYAGAVEMARDHRGLVELGLKLKKAGNDIVTLLGGREIHPINVRLGGFYRIPETARFAELCEQLKWAREAAETTVRTVADFDFPDFEQDYEFVALSHPDEYPMNEGRIVSSRGLDIDVTQWPDWFEEEHVERSNALHCRRRDGGHYMVGPLARYALNHARLGERARAAAAAAGLEPVCRNPFRSIIVRAVEMVEACDEAIRILEDFTPPEQPFVEVPARAGTGHAATEAPRGLLYHRYVIDDEGLIQEAQIVPPTSQNQGQIEDDLRAFVAPRLALDDDTLQWQCEQSIRNYDPCISCATHFLRLDVERT
ncbi:MAG: Ni/Fe hydrogenase subunit alpha [Gammaproteobacteria bacterium]|nr:MAG: Ni/Fe hydrogenase subunit alpha [Gammaproteobacteria bacterium]